jgi:hypothetical protein
VSVESERIARGGRNILSQFYKGDACFWKGEKKLLVEISHISEDSKYYYGSGKDYFLIVRDDKYKKGRKWDPKANYGGYENGRL